jgi:hypothetical protein
MRTLLKTSLLIAAAFLCTERVAQASTLEVTVPFPFVVNGHTLPAGQYRVDHEGPVVLLSQEHGGHEAVYVLTRPETGKDPAGEKPALTFRRDENQYRLADVWDHDGQGYVLVPQ